jgi:nicotinate phosphoribosyltransferase
MKTPGRARARPMRLPGIDAGRLVRGHYSDAYFLNAARILARLARSGALHRGASPALREEVRGLETFRPGDAEVEMQFFARRRPRYVAAGIDLALGLLRDGVRHGADAGRGPAKRPNLRVLAIADGDLAHPLEPVLVVRGRYRDFAHLETPLLGVLTRASRVATNVYEALLAARGKPILFFPARFDLPQTQVVDGYAYRVALAAHARATGTAVAPCISTDAQGMLWGGKGTGTTAHAYILCHLGDTAEAMAAFCRHLPRSVQRVALGDTTNDCVGESVRAARRLFDEHLRHLRAGRADLARRFVLHGVRADTAAGLRDRSVPPSRDPRLERGVTPALVRLIRDALDHVPSTLALGGRWRRVAGDYFRSIRIVATGGFDPEKIRFFEARRAPVDIYGIGSCFLRGPASDFTADVVRVKIGSRYAIVAKTGRGPRRNPRLRPVSLS